MKKRLRLLLKVFTVTGIILITIAFCAQFFLKRKIENRLKALSTDSMEFNYGYLNLSLFRNNLTIKDIKVKRQGKSSKKPILSIVLKALEIDGISYWRYILNDHIHIKDIVLTSPEIVYHHNKQVSKHEYQASDKFQFKKRINVDNVLLENGALSVYEFKNDSLLGNVGLKTLQFEGLFCDSESIKNKIPFEFNGFSLQLDSTFFSLGDYENLYLKSADITNDKSIIRDLKLVTKYSREQLSKTITNERDHFNLQVDSLGYEGFKLGFRQDSILQISCPRISFYQPNLKVYRDKLVEDDPSVKPLYSRMLRNLKADLNVDTVFVKNADISYSEKVRTDRPAGEITFSNFNATVKNLSNTYSLPTKTELNINTMFMKHAPLSAFWQFNVNDTSDSFLFQVDIGKLQADYLNTFTKPNFNKLIEGQLERTYATIYGNSEESQIDFKVKYDRFDIVALKSNGKEKNEFLSDIFNLFVSKNSRNPNGDFKEVIKKNIKRNKTKSAFNYIWINVRSGLLGAMTND